MKLIRDLSEMVDDEIADAHKYAKCALEQKDQNPALARVFNELSAAETQHMTILHTEVTKLIEQYRQQHGDIPEGMKALYDYLHQKQIDKAAEVRNLQAMYRGA